MKDIYDAVLRNDIKFIREFENIDNITDDTQKTRIEAAITYRDNNGNSPVHLAAMNGNVVILNIFFFYPHGYAKHAKQMLQVKNVQGVHKTDGYTPLDMALLNDHLKCVACIMMHFPQTEHYLAEPRLKAMGVKPATLKTTLGFKKYIKKEGIHDRTTDGLPYIYLPNQITFPKDIDEQIREIWRRTRTKILSANRHALERNRPLLIISAEFHGGVRGAIARFIVASVCHAVGIRNFCIEAVPSVIANWLIDGSKFYYHFLKYCLELGVNLREVDGAHGNLFDHLVFLHPNDEELSLMVEPLRKEHSKRNQTMIDNIKKISARAILFTGAAHAKEIAEGLEKTFHILTINIQQETAEEYNYSKLQEAGRGYSLVDYHRAEEEYLYRYFVYQCVIPGEELRVMHDPDHAYAYDVFSRACKDRLDPIRKKQVLPLWLENNIREHLKNVEKSIPDDCEVFKLITSGFQISSKLNNEFQKALVFQYSKITKQDCKLVAEYLQKEPEKEEPINLTAKCSLYTSSLS